MANTQKTAIVTGAVPKTTQDWVIWASSFDWAVEC